MAKDKKKKKNRTGSEKLRARRERGFELLTSFLADKKKKEKKNKKKEKRTSPEQAPG